MRERVRKSFIDYEKAFNNLVSAVKDTADELDIDGTIKRFELCYELSWKLIKSYLEDMGIICKNPRDCFKQAFANGIIENEKTWMDIIEDRNLLVHTYNAEESRVVFFRIKERYLNAFRFLYDSIKGVIKDDEC